MSENKLVLYGDGEHDDTIALQAWLNDEPVVFPDGTIVGDSLRNLKFKLSNHLVDKGLRTNISEIVGCEFTGGGLIVKTEWVKVVKQNA